MRWTKEIIKLCSVMVSSALSDVHTNIPAKVVSYDAANNTCSVQPCIMRVRTDDPDHTSPLQLPQVDDLPVQQQGSGKLLLSVAPQVGSYGALVVTERCIENWIKNGGIVTAVSSRKFHFSDGYFVPGLYPLATDGDNGKLQAAIATDRISLRTRNGNAEVSVLDDDSVLTEGTETVLQSGTDWAVQYTALKSAFDTLKGDFNNLVSAYNSHIHVTTATVGVGSAVGVLSATVSSGTASTADMSGSKVSDVRVP